MNNLNIYADITKVDEDQRMVWGYASTEALDYQGERVAKDAIEKALPEYMKFRNIREMHTSSAVGTAEEATIDDKGLYIGAKVIDDNAWKKVKAKVYKGFSIGGSRISKTGDLITELKLSEISLVDRPANPEAVFDVYKADIEISTGEIGEIIGASESIDKGMNTVCALAQILSDLDRVQMAVNAEANLEADGSKLPAKLKVAVKNLGDILRQMTGEEVKEITDGKRDIDFMYSEKTEDLSKSDDVKTEVKAEEIVAEEVKTEAQEMTKAAVTNEDLMQKISDFQSDLRKLADENLALKEKIEKFESLPAPAKGYAKAVGKDEDDIRKMEDANVAKTPEDLIKSIHAQGGRPYV